MGPASGLQSSAGRSNRTPINDLRKRTDVATLVLRDWRNGFPMELLLILYSVFAGSLLIWCTLLEPKPVKPKCALHYVVISGLLLNEWRRARSDLVVIDLRDHATNIDAGALNVLPAQLDGLLRWIPPKTTLVFCGVREAELCRGAIKPTLLRVGIHEVYVVEGNTASSTSSTSLERARV